MDAKFTKVQIFHWVECWFQSEGIGGGGGWGELVYCENATTLGTCWDGFGSHLHWKKWGYEDGFRKLGNCLL